MDGKFVERDTYQNMIEYSNYIKRISNLPIDVHLMVEDVKNAIEDFSAIESKYYYISFRILQDKRRSNGKYKTNKR